MSNGLTFAQMHERRRRLARERGLSKEVLRGMYDHTGAHVRPAFPEEMAPKRAYFSMGTVTYSLLRFALKEWRALKGGRNEATLFAVLATYAMEVLNHDRAEAGLVPLTADWDALLAEWEDTITDPQYKRERGFRPPRRRFAVNSEGIALELIPTKEELQCNTLPTE